MKKYSHFVSSNPSQPAAKAMLHAIGLNDEELEQPFIGIGSTGYEGIHAICILTNFLKKESVNKNSLMG